MTTAVTATNTKSTIKTTINREQAERRSWVKRGRYGSTLPEFREEKDKMDLKRLKRERQ